MTIPDYQSLMLPILEFSSDGQEHSLREVREAMAVQFELNSGEIKQLLPSGRQPVFSNRVAWAKTYLQQAGLLSSTRRGFFIITDQGKETVLSGPAEISSKYLERFESFLEFRKRSGKAKDQKPISDLANEDPSTPEEQLENAFQRLRDELETDLLDRVLSSSPAFFERLVLDLLLRMGYGGSRRDAALALGRSGDQGIDGVINEDRLGLDVIYIQAKRWEGTVGRPEIQKFVGSLHGQHARKGVFVTTGRFSKEAREYVTHIDPKVVLIDGERLAGLMIDFDLGVSTVESFALKKTDTDYFDDE